MKITRKCKKCNIELTGCRIIKKYGDKSRVSCPRCGAENFIYPKDIVMPKNDNKGGEKGGDRGK